MSNFDIAREATSTAENSDGSADRELGKQQQSLQYSLDKMKATWQEFSTTAMNSDFLKGAVDAAQALLEIITKISGLGDGLGLAGILGAGAAGFGIFKNRD